jgi:hypothetical protein
MEGSFDPRAYCFFTSIDVSLGHVSTFANLEAVRFNALEADSLECCW